MAKMRSTHPLGNLDTLSRTAGDAGVTLTVRHGFAMAQAFARKDRMADALKALNVADIPGEATETALFTALPLAPGQWMLVSKTADDAFADKISRKLKDSGFVSQQGDARVCFRISGPKARDLMSRGCRLDLHPDVTGKGFCAQTPMAQVGVLLHQVAADPVYDLYVYSGFARAFWHWLETTAAQFGYDVDVSP